MYFHSVIYIIGRMLSSENVPTCDLQYRHLRHSLASEKMALKDDNGPSRAQTASPKEKSFVHPPSAQIQPGAPQSFRRLVKRGDER
jgi:hypothetical protein